MTKEWCAIAPIFTVPLPQNGQITTPVIFNKEIEIIPIPEWIEKDPLIFKKFHFTSSPIAIKYNFRAKNIFIPSDQITPSPINQAISIVNYLCYSVWLSTPSQFTNFMIFYAFKEKGKWKVDYIQKVSPIFIWHQSVEKVTNNHLSIAQKIFLTILGFDNSLAVKLSIDFGIRALTEFNWEIRFLLLWIALESLFGTKIETAFQVSQRIACFINTDGGKLKETFEMIKKSYNIRNMLAHGSGNSKKLTLKQSTYLMRDIQNWYKTSITKILQSPDLIKKINQKDQEKKIDFFNDLIFHNLSNIKSTH